MKSPAITADTHPLFISETDLGEPGEIFAPVIEAAPAPLRMITEADLGDFDEHVAAHVAAMSEAMASGKVVFLRDRGRR